MTYGKSAFQSSVINASVANRVNYREQFVMCYPGSKWKQYSMYDWFTDFAQVAHVNTGNDCGAKAAGSTWDTESATSSTISNGVDIGPISLSAQSGYGASQDLQVRVQLQGEDLRKQPEWSPAREPCGRPAHVNRLLLAVLLVLVVGCTDDEDGGG